MADLSDKSYEASEQYAKPIEPLLYMGFFRKLIVKPLAKWFSDGSW